MPKLSINNVRKPGRPPVNSKAYTVRVPPALDAKIDAWVEGQSDNPGKPEAIRRLIEQGLTRTPR